MSTEQDLKLVRAHLTRPSLRSLPNGPAVNALQRLEDSHASLLAMLETINEEASIDDDERWRILHVSHLDKASKIIATAKR